MRIHKDYNSVVMPFKGGWEHYSCKCRSLIYSFMSNIVCRKRRRGLVPWETSITEIVFGLISWRAKVLCLTIALFTF